MNRTEFADRMVGILLGEDHWGEGQGEALEKCAALMADIKKLGAIVDMPDVLDTLGLVVESLSEEVAARSHAGKNKED